MRSTLPTGAGGEPRLGAGSETASHRIAASRRSSASSVPLADLIETSIENVEPRTAAQVTEALWRPVSRFVLAVVLGAGFSLLVWRKVPSQLSVKSTVIGYPIFANFDYQRYLDAYYCIAIVFPVVAIVVCALLGRWGPLRRPKDGRSHFYRIATVSNDQTTGGAAALPVAVSGPGPDAEELPSTAPPASLGSATGSATTAPPAVSVFWAVARMAVVAITIAIEVCLIRSPVQVQFTRGGFIAGGIYMLAVAAGAVLLKRLWKYRNNADSENSHPGWRDSFAYSNSFLALSVIPLLFFVSEKTNIYISSEHRVVYYHWLPLWLVIVVTVGCVALWARGVRRARRSIVERTEPAVLTWVVGPVVFFLLLAVLPGAIGTFLGFDDAQFLAAPQLIFHHGLFPWRDIFLLHGIFQDVLWGAVGLLVFGNTRWGGDAGIGLLMTPLFWLVVYGFTAYFCRKNRLILVGLVVAVTTGLLQGNTFRFLVIFVFLVLFDRLLRRPTWAWCALFSSTLVVACIIVPESLLFALCLGVLVVVFELVTYRKGAPVAARFRRTIRCSSVGIALLVVWTIYLAVVGALGSFISYYVVAALDHAIVGALPIQWNLAHTTMTTFEFVAPVVLWLATVWRVVAKMRARRPWSFADWSMVGAALFVLVYYPQELERMDGAHVQLVFCVTLPLLILWSIELLSIADRGMGQLASRLGRQRRPRSLGSVRRIGEGAGWPKRLATAVAVVATAALSITMPVSIPTLVRRIPGNFHAVAPVPAPAKLAKLGYTLPGTVDTAQINELGRLLDRYAGRHAPVFDFPNELGVTYYLLNRVPGTRYFAASEAQTSMAQGQVVSDLKKSKPPVVIFYDASFGLPVYDGILESVRTPTIAEYLLDNYRPLVDMQGQLLMLRNDLVKSAPPLPALPPGSESKGLYFSIPACTLGDIPNFYATPAGLDAQSGIKGSAVQVEGIGSIVGGWAVDPNTGKPASEVVAVAGGRVVATAPTGIDRSDVAAVLKDPSAETSGFSIEIPKKVAGPVTLYAVEADGSVTMLQRDTQTVPSTAVSETHATSIVMPDGTSHMAIETGAAGWADSYQKPNEVILKLVFPKGTNPASYRWLQLRSASPLGTTSNYLTNNLGAGPDNQVGFNSLPSAGTSLSVQVGSCLQWHGYDAAESLYLVRSGPGAGRRVSVELRR